MKIAKVKFGIGKYTFDKGQHVPKEVSEKYPHLVEDSPEEKVAAKEPEFVQEVKLSTKKRK